MKAGTYLVTGGAGYIGAHVVLRLRELGRRVVVLDDLSTGFREAVGDAELVQGDCGDAALLARVLGEASPVGVLHFAGRTDVEESMRDPGLYYRANFGTSLRLLEALAGSGAPPLVFSSSAAVYGEPGAERVDESHPQAPANPYGHSKRMVEQALADFQRAHGLPYASLRYFNVAGADPQGRAGDRRSAVPSLIPRVLQAAAGLRGAFELYGEDYPTRDGTCVRDFIHVADLAEAHLLALDYLQQGGAPGAFNLGNGAGFTVREVLEAARRVTGRSIPARVMPRRAGDIATMVADSTRAQRVLGWRPRYGALETMLEHAWRWQCRAQSGA